MGADGEAAGGAGRGAGVASGSVPRRTDGDVPSSVKLTLPVGLLVPVTVAVKVTGAPNVAGVPELASVVVVGDGGGAGLTVKL